MPEQTVRTAERQPDGRYETPVLQRHGSFQNLTRSGLAGPADGMGMAPLAHS